MKMTRFLVVGSIAALNLGCLVVGLLGLRFLLQAGPAGIVAAIVAFAGLLACAALLTRDPRTRE